MSAPGRVRAVIDTLRGELARDPEALRQYAMDLLCELSGSDVAVWYEIGLVDGDPVPVRWRVRGIPTTVMQSHLDGRLPWPQGDPRLPDPHLNRRFVSLRSVVGDPYERLYPTRIYRTCWEPWGIDDQIRMTVHHGGRFVAFVGAYRTRADRAYTRADVRRLAPISDALADALITADAIERAGCPEEGADLVLTPEGLVEYASASAAAFLASSRLRGALVAWARAADSTAPDAPVPRVLEGHRLRWSRLSGPSGSRCLLHLERVEPLPIHPSFVLSRTQRVIAGFAACGATTLEIAQTLDVTASTVRTHLRQAYRLLDVSTRAELVRALADAPPGYS